MLIVAKKVLKEFELFKWNNFHLSWCRSYNNDSYLGISAAHDNSTLHKILDLQNKICHHRRSEKVEVSTLKLLEIINIWKYINVFNQNFDINLSLQTCFWSVGIEKFGNTFIYLLNQQIFEIYFEEKVSWYHQQSCLLSSNLHRVPESTSKCQLCPHCWGGTCR